MSDSKTLSFSGPKASILMNGVKIGFTSSFSVTEDNTLTDVDVLDQLEVAEQAETGHKVSFTMNMFKIDGNSMVDLNITPDNIEDQLLQQELSFEVYNRITNKAEYTLMRCKYKGGSGSVDSRGLWQGVANFGAVKRGPGGGSL